MMKYDIHIWIESFHILTHSWIKQHDSVKHELIEKIVSALSVYLTEQQNMQLSHE